MARELPPADDAPDSAGADCPSLRAVQDSLRRMAQPTAAEQAAACLAQYLQSRAPRRRPNDAERDRLRELRAVFANPDAATQWGAAGMRVRYVLVLFAGLREFNPGESVRSIADREWPEFTPTEQAAIGQAVRLLLRALVKLSAISGGR